MSEPINFLGKLDAGKVAQFLAALANAMSDETIRPFRTLSEAERAGVRIAIVANPDPAEKALLPNLAWIQRLWAGSSGRCAISGRSACRSSV